MAKALVVVRPFGDFAKGERIRNPADVKRFAVSHEHFVRVIEEADAPAEEAAPDAKPEA